MISESLRNELPEGSIVFDAFAYDGAIVGVTTDDRVVYNYDLMVEELVNDEGLSVDEAVEWIECNTIRSLPYIGDNAPIIFYPLEVET